MLNRREINLLLIFNIKKFEQSVQEFEELQSLKLHNNPENFSEVDLTRSFKKT